MRFEWFVARRYLRSPYRPAVLRLVTLFSVIGVTAGVATLVVALAMNTGFKETLQDRLLAVTAHVSLTRSGTGGIQNYNAIAARLAALPGVRSATPAIYQPVLLSFGGDARGVVAKGVDPNRAQSSDEALQHIIAGQLDFSANPEGIDSLLVGKELARDWKISPGDFVTLLSPQGRLTPYGIMPRTRRFRVAGIFDSGFYDYDANWCFLNLPAAQILSGAGDIVNVLEFRLEQPERAEELAAQISREAGPGYSTSTWMQENRALFRALRLEKLVTSIFIGLITFVAGLNILVVLTMTVTDKARDIAVLVSMGARREQIRKIFLAQGVAIGATGTILGLAIGYGFAWFAGVRRLIPLDPQVYSVPYVPFHPSLADGVWITVVSLAISVGATLIPARAAAKLLPVDILRYE